MLGCGYECHMVGGPWIAENPSCPFHGSNAHYTDTSELQMVSAETIKDLWLDHFQDDGQEVAQAFAYALINAYRELNGLG